MKEDLLIKKLKGIAEQVANRTKHSYSYNAYGWSEWLKVADFLISEGYTEAEAEYILLSKIPRWARDQFSKSSEGKLEHVVKYIRVNNYDYRGTY